MKVVFVHHGEKEKKKEDPALTFFGHTLAQKVAQWIREQGIVPQKLLSTSTQRTIQTAQAIQKEFKEEHLSIDIQNIPDLWNDWLCLGEELFQKASFPCVLVAHHPTIAMLKEEFRLNLSLATFASVIVIERKASEHWNVVQHKQGTLAL